jgi:hypothetical protein
MMNVQKYVLFFSGHNNFEATNMKCVRPAFFAKIVLQTGSSSSHGQEEEKK